MLLIFFAVFGDILLVILVLMAAMKFKLIFPHSLKGLLFYLQTSYYTTEYFPISFWDIRQYVSSLQHEAIVNADCLNFPWFSYIYCNMLETTFMAVHSQYLTKELFLVA